MENYDGCKDCKYCSNHMRNINGIPEDYYLCNYDSIEELSFVEYMYKKSINCPLRKEDNNEK